MIVPTRGQSHLIKQRCMSEGLPLLGVEFLTPGLARKKWITLTEDTQSALGREFLLLGLRSCISRNLTALPKGDPARGFWRSLQSDPERALDDFDALLKAGWRARDFPRPELAAIFLELTTWVESSGCMLAPVQSELAALQPLTPTAPRVGGRLLVVGLTAESWGEFFNVVALIRRMDAVTVVLPEPAFRGRGALDEKWIELWQSLLGVEPELAEEGELGPSCAAVGALWTHEDGSAAKSMVIVGRTRTDEMALVAHKIRELLAAGAGNIGVIFPRADAAHLRLTRLLTTADVPFADLLESAGPPPVDVQVQRALVTFYARGARLDELLLLWPRLRAIGAVTQSTAAARDVCERLFDETQSHALANNLGRLQQQSRPAGQEVARIAAIILPAWPAELTLSEARERFEHTCEQLDLELTANWIALRTFADRTQEKFPVAVVLETLAAFLPEKSAVPAAPGRGVFARVTLTSRRRAEGLTWSHLLLVESNAGVWPERREPSCWLTDEARTDLNRRGRFSLGIFTVEDRAGLERQGFASLAADTQERVIFSASLFDEAEPELQLAPNSWLERVLWSQGKAQEPGGLEQAFANLAQTTEAPSGGTPQSEWLKIWHGRRDAGRPFDEWFFAADPAKIKPDHLSARLIESGVQDPVELWFSAVLGIKRVAWEPLVRIKPKIMGQLVHGLLAAALRSTEVSPTGFGPMPSPETAEKILQQKLAQLREQWPRDFYWDSFHAELAAMARELLAQALGCGAGDYVATELRLPSEAVLQLGDMTLPVTGRMDLVRADRPQWQDANIEIVDFKTGGDAKLSAERMGRNAAGLQLGIYLAAAQSLKIAGGQVWMLKPRADGATPLELVDLPVALGQLERLQRMLTDGIYGALTPDRSNYGPGGLVWPLACPPVAQKVLARKYCATFGGVETEEASDE